MAPVVLYGCETWSFVLKEQTQTEGLRAQGTEEEYGHKTKESKTKIRENYIMRSLINCTSHHVVLG
jgi:hypothetical protein